MSPKSLIVSRERAASQQAGVGKTEAPQRALQVLLDQLTSQRDYLNKTSQRLEGLVSRLNGAELGLLEKKDPGPPCGLMQQLKDAASEIEALIAAIDNDVTRLEEIA